VRIAAGFVIAVLVVCLRPPGPALGACLDYDEYAHGICTVDVTSVRSVAVSGNFAYVHRVGVYPPQLKVIDISDPRHSVMVGSLDLPETNVCLEAAGSYVYMGTPTKFQVVDVSDPLHPTVVGSLNRPYQVRSIGLFGHYACLATCQVSYHAPGWFEVVDVADPANPRLVSSMGPMAGSTTSVDVSGSFAYLVVYEVGLLVMDISNPASPQLVGTAPLPEPAGVAISGEYAYVTTMYAAVGHVDALDISDPTAPHVVSTVEHRGYYGGIAVASDRAYIALGATGLDVIDIGDPLHMRFAGALYTSQAVGVTARDHYAFLADGEGGFKVIDSEFADSAPPAGDLRISDTLCGVAVSGRFVVVTGSDLSTIYLVDMADPEHPVLVDYMDTVGSPTAVAFLGDMAYVAEQGVGLLMVRIEDGTPPRIHFMDRIRFSGSGTCLALSGNRVYFGTSDRGLVVIENGMVVGSIATPLPIRGLAVTGSGQYIYVGEQIEAPPTAKLEVIDVSDPAHPVAVASQSLPYGYMRLAISGTCAYVASGGLRVLDISDPRDPKFVASLYTPGAHDVAVANGHVYVAEWTDGYVGSGNLQIVDVSDPKHPEQLGEVGLPRIALAAAVWSEAALVASPYSLEIRSTQCVPGVSLVPGEPVLPEGGTGLDLAVLPNPTYGCAALRIVLPAEAHVSAVIYAVSGRQVRHLPVGALTAGRHDLTWDGRDDLGREVAPGVYLARVSTEAGTGMARVVIMR
jgi:hypothetical protein